ncbi:MAG TPA: hypothetical protein VIU85_05310 [Chthoniobacterales bacterium]
MHLDLAIWLNVISTIAIVAALIFTALQVRQANIKRRDQASITLIQTIQSEGWTRMLELISKLPEGAQASDVEAAGPEVQRAVIDFGIRLETVGYMVFRRYVDLCTVDEMIGGITLAFWARGKGWLQRERERTGTPKYAEWCEWLADRIAERRDKLGHEPAQILYADWRE